MRFKKLPFVRRADEGDCSAKITDVSPGQIMTIAKGTGLPEDLLRACRFKHNPNRPCVYDAWGIAGGILPKQNQVRAHTFNSKNNSYCNTSSQRAC